MAHSSYAPEDAGITPALLDFLQTEEGACLRDEVRHLLQQHSPPTVADVVRLRKQFPANAGAPVRAALTLGQIQQTAKFDLPYVWGVPEAVQQATDCVVARHKAMRYSHIGANRIYDLCAGIGGDTLALAEVAPVTAIDLSPVRVKCLQLNLAEKKRAFDVSVCIGDVRDAAAEIDRQPGVLFHIDPARRTAGKRSPRWEDLIPGPPVIEHVMRHFIGGAIKLSPAVDFASLPAGHLEIISHNRVVVQAVLWVGEMATPFAPGERTATILLDSLQGRSAAPLSFEIRHTPVQFPPYPTHSIPLGPYLYELDGAITRAALAFPLAHNLGLQCLTTDGGYATGLAEIQSPALTRFEVLGHTRFGEDRVATLLKETAEKHPCAPGAVEVKTRGGLPGIDTDRLQVLWTKAAPWKQTVLIFKREDDVIAILARRF